MKTRQCLLALLAGSSLCGVSTAAHGDITFLNHFNDTSSYDINASNDDFAAGSGTATTAGTPGFATGFFPGSTPGNNALQLNNDFESVSYAASGNVQFTSPTSGGITVGTWFKHNTVSNVNRLFIIGAAGLDDDYLQVDVGASNPNILRTQFRDGASGSLVSQSSTTVNTTDWHYVASTVDLTNSELKTYLFNSSGTLIGGTPLTSSITVTGWNVNTGTITLGDRTIPDGSATQDIDEFSIDNVVLTQSEIQARVNDMIAGNQLVVPEPSSLGLLGLGTLLTLRRRRAA